MRFCAEVEYDGTGYFGFQRQREEPTIQNELEQAIYLVSNSRVPVDFAGRTDAGVHAMGQVIAFNLDWKHSHSDLFRAINAKLPEAIALRTLSQVQADFHPRFDAKERIYRYYIYNSPVRSPHKRRNSWHVRRLLDVQAMNETARSIIGEHDFAAFGTPPQGTNTVRTVFDCEWVREDDMVVFSIKANAFLKRMVRSLVGTMKLVGDGSWTVVDFESAFTSRLRNKAGQTAPSSGLFLMSVTFDAEMLGE